jgi:hypothetical protein
MTDDDKVFAPETIPDHERSLGRMLCETAGHTFFPLKSLHEAKSYEDGVVILQGDDGGQIYVVCVAAQVACSEQNLEMLLRDLDEIAWPGNDPDACHIYYERRAVGASVAGGMGGAAVTAAPWIHPDFVELGLAPMIREVIQAKRERIR